MEAVCFYMKGCELGLQELIFFFRAFEAGDALVGVYQLHTLRFHAGLDALAFDIQLLKLDV